MQGAKSTEKYKIDHFSVSLTAFSEKKLTLTVFDPLQKLQFQEKELVLENIGTSTLMKALQRNKIQLKIQIRVVKGAEDPKLQIEVLVSSQFLRPVSELICLKKKRSVSEAEIIKSAVDYLGIKIKQVKEKDGENPNSLYVSKVLEEKNFNSGTNYEQLGSVKLSKGKYLLTLSFLLKATSQWIYIYMNQGAISIMQNCGFYVPTTSYFMPHTIRKVHSVTDDSQVVTFQTYYGQSYPVQIKNLFITAKKID